jgi:flagella basal body P-ring formation protein FlgA
MMKSAVMLLTMLFTNSAIAQAVVPIQTIRARDLISAEVLEIRDLDARGATTELNQVIGMEARTALYPGRRIFARDLTMPATIARNSVVALVFVQGGLRIKTEGRALERGSVGDYLKVMNLMSRSIVIGLVMPNGSVEVN